MKIIWIKLPYYIFSLLARFSHLLIVVTATSGLSIHHSDVDQWTQPHDGWPGWTRARNVFKTCQNFLVLSRQFVTENCPIMFERVQFVTVEQKKGEYKRFCWKTKDNFSWISKQSHFKELLITFAPEFAFVVKIRACANVIQRCLFRHLVSSRASLHAAICVRVTLASNKNSCQLATRWPLEHFSQNVCQQNLIKICHWCWILNTKTQVN